MLDVAVIGVPDARMGEVGVTFVVAKNLAEAEVVDWARERLANYKVPRHVVFVDDLPRNSSMKVLKSTLRKQYETSCA